MHHECTEDRRESRRIRVATYNIHKCRGLDGRVLPDRILQVLRELNADVIALQEVTRLEGGNLERDHARFLADELGFHVSFGENRRLGDAAYGNALLTRFPIEAVQNYEITSRGREPRGCLRTDVKLDKTRILHIFNVHLGTGFFERREQARLLFHTGILNAADLSAARLVLGDFNEWTRGLASQLLASHFKSADPRLHLGGRRTYPGLLPLLHLDHIYFDTTLELRRLALHRSKRAIIASDHLPFVADFSVSGWKPRLVRSIAAGNSAENPSLRSVDSSLLTPTI